MERKVSLKKKEGEPQHFLKQILEKPPADAKYNPEKPNVTYEIDHVYGFSGDRYKNGLHFGKNNDEIVFSAAALGIT